MSQMEYVFCHIPKTGGISIGKAVGQKPNHKIMDKKIINKFLFTFVRNPYDRMISTYFYLKNGGRNLQDKKDSHEFISNLSLSDFIFQKLEISSMNQQHFKPQNYWIPNGADFIGKYEKIDSDFEILKEVLKIDKNKKLEHLNTSNKTTISLNNREKREIFRIYQKDFELFNYFE